jgi:polyribonucleotide nucleotidyltransferase
MRQEIINYSIFEKNLKLTLINKNNTNSITVNYGGIVLHGSIVVSKLSNKNTNLTIYYKEASYVNIKNFNKKSFSKSDKEVRISRQIDRSIRPFFSEVNEDVTITIMLLQNTHNDNVLPCILWTAFLLCHRSGLSNKMKNPYSNIFYSPGKGEMVISVNDEGIVMMEGYFNKFDKQQVIEEVIKILDEQKNFRHIYGEISVVNLLENFKSPMVVENYKKRLDGRKWKDIRDINITLNPLHMTSVIFTRGETSVLTVMNITENDYNDFNLQYKFHPFSVGESGETFGNSRREKGHSFLVQNSFKYIQYKYLSYDVIGEVLFCNGSSSMATACGTSLCLYIEYGEDLISGITCGIIGDKFLVDLRSNEDQISQCDIKVVSNREKQILSVFMDTKVTINIMQLEELLQLALESNIKIIKKMEEAVEGLKYRTIVQIKKEKLVYFIGKNNSQELENMFDVKLKIYDCGLVVIKSSNKQHFNAVTEIVNSYNPLLHDKEITCLVKNKKILENKTFQINLGPFVYTTEKFKYEIGDVIKGVIDNGNNTSPKILLNNIKRVKISC